MWRIGVVLLCFLVARNSSASEWKSDGYNKATDGLRGFFSASISKKDISFSVMCNPDSRTIGLGVLASGPLAAAELGDRAAKAAEGGGAYDLLIGGTAYPLSASYDPQNGMLRFADPVSKDGQLLEDLMSASEVIVSNSPLKLGFPLKGSREVICEALAACKIEQNGCRIKGY